MMSLRAKLAVLVAGVIIGMVMVLTGVLILILRPPGALQGIAALADQAKLMSDVAERAPSLVVIRPGPADGPRVADVTEKLRWELHARGMHLEALVSEGTAREELWMSVRVPQGWVATSIADLPPQGGVGWRIVMWLAVIAFGAMIVALFIANRMVRPLLVLQRAAGTIGDDAILPTLDVKGPPEVQATAKALNSLSSRLRDAMESRMRLVAAAGHDLRTPITRMRLRAEFVEDESDRAMWLKDIHELSNIADSAILLVKEETVRSAPEVIHLDELIAELVEDLRCLSFDICIMEVRPVEVIANPVSLKRAFRNLMTNAVTYGTRARVYLRPCGADAIVTIHDDGPGIPPEMLGRVFEPFFRVHPSRSKESEGAGLGLTIALEIVQRARGRVTIENGADIGLVQTVVLPLSSSAQPTANQALASSLP